MAIEKISQVAGRALPLRGDNIAVAINNHGEIAGWSYCCDHRVHAFLWQKGTTRDLGTLGGLSSTAVAINRPSGSSMDFNAATAASPLRPDAAMARC